MSATFDVVCKLFHFALGMFVVVKLSLTGLAFLFSLCKYLMLLYCPFSFSLYLILFVCLSLFIPF